MALILPRSLFRRLRQLLRELCTTPGTACRNPALDLRAHPGHTGVVLVDLAREISNLWCRSHRNRSYDRGKANFLAPPGTALAQRWRITNSVILSCKVVSFPRRAGGPRSLQRCPACRLLRCGDGHGPSPLIARCSSVHYGYQDDTVRSCNVSASVVLPGTELQPCVRQRGRDLCRLGAITTPGGDMRARTREPCGNQARSQVRYRQFLKFAVENKLVRGLVSRRIGEDLSPDEKDQTTAPLWVERELAERSAGGFWQGWRSGGNSARGSARPALAAAAGPRWAES